MRQESPFLVVSQPEISILGQINCARKRLLVVAPGLTEEVARAVASKWLELGRDAVQIVLDPNPDNCRLGYGDLSALQLLHSTAAKLGATILEQAGIRIGIIVTDETTTIYAPTPRLVESGGEPGEQMNAIRFDLSEASDIGREGQAIDLQTIDLDAVPLTKDRLDETAQNLRNDPPLKFDVTQRIRVFNTLFEFVELELNGMSLAKKKVTIPSELLGLAGDQEDRNLLNSNCNLIDRTSSLSGTDLMKARQKIDDGYLTSLPGYGKVILRSDKDEFLKRIDEFKGRIDEHKKIVERDLEAEIETKRQRLFKGLLPAVLANPPRSWVKAYPQDQRKEVVIHRLAEELEKAFGKVDALVGAMEVKVLFKGVTYEMLSDPHFLAVAGEKLPSLADLHREFSAVEAREN
jgi:hypothetical protein